MEFTKKELDELIEKSGMETTMSSRTKSLQVYFGGRSKRFAEVYFAVSKSSVPTELGKAVACSLLNGYMNGRIGFPGRVNCKPPYVQEMRDVLALMTDSKAISKAFPFMNEESLRKWKEMIDFIDKYKQEKGK